MTTSGVIGGSTRRQTHDRHHRRDDAEHEQPARPAEQQADDHGGPVVNGCGRCFNGGVRALGIVLAARPRPRLRAARRDGRRPVRGGARAHGRRDDRPARREGRARARGDAQGAAPRVRPGRPRDRGLRRRARPHRPRADRQPAVHGRRDDRARGARPAARACSRSGPAAATRPRSSPRWRARCTRSSSWSRSRRAPAGPSSASATAASTCGTATAIAAGPRRRRSTPSWSPRRRPRCRSALLEQLAPGGRLVAPSAATSRSWRSTAGRTDGIQVRRFFPVSFVPMVPGKTETR